MLKKSLLEPINDLANDGKLTGILLILATVISLGLSNSPLSDSYLSFWKIEFGPKFFYEPLIYWINDALMAIFFFLVGLEIKRELTLGQLSDRKQAMLPIIAAAGGMVMPALIFVSFNFHSSFLEGWAIPTATDIAFSLGILSLLGKKVPASLKIFLTALAIIDDLGAVLIIAFFYTSNLHWGYLLLALFCVIALFILNRLKVARFIFYLPFGLLLWFFVFESGIHATIAGVLFAFMIPLSLVEKLEHQLHRPVNYLIMPVFALANTAILIPMQGFSAFISPLSGGVILGLLAGKPIGIFAASFYAVKQGIARLPVEVNWRHVFGVGCTAGIGFTMSIFIANLSFTEILQLDIAKVSVLLGSLFSALAGWIILSRKSNSLP